MSMPWWRSIPYLASSERPAAPLCVTPAWFIVSYVEISLVLPLITYIICRMASQSARLACIAFLCVVSSFQIAIKLYNQSTFSEEGYLLYGGFLADLFEKFESMGNMSTLGRLGDVSVGCLVGYLLRMYEIERIKQWPKWLRSRLVMGLLSLVLVIIFLSPAIGSWVLQWNERIANSS